LRAIRVFVSQVSKARPFDFAQGWLWNTQSFLDGQMWPRAAFSCGDLIESKAGPKGLIEPICQFPGA